MLLEDLVTASRQVAATRSRLAKTATLADVLRRAEPAEIELVADYLAGRMPQRRTGVGWRSLSELPEPAAEATLSVSAVDDTMTALESEAGEGSAARRKALVANLFGAATAEEQHFLRSLVTGELRQGALDGVLLLAIATAADLPQEPVRRAVMLAGFAGPVARAALTEGLAGLEAITLVPGRPLRPMLAGSAPDVPAAVASAAADIDAETGAIAIDRKLDGIRLQIHKIGDDVRLFTRSLDEITDRLPEVVEFARSLTAHTAVLDAEALTLRPDGSPEAFQVTGSRTSSQVRRDRDTAVVSAFCFDVLHLDGDDLLDLPLTDRLARLDTLVPEQHRVPRLMTADPAEATAFFDEQVASGHEGVIVKNLRAPYAAGRRGAGWVKVKPRHTLDLVVLGVEWGSGRRRGLLSNIHLGARDTRSADGGFVMLGKTFKGMTDEMLAWQTERFLELETHRDGHVVFVRPEQVVEIALDGVQRSTRYPGGVALRFARVVRYRDDKTPAETDTLDTVRALSP